jgi:CarboxypepD_reg-like domain
MTAKHICLFLLIACFHTALSQSTLKGIVINGETGNPLPSISVYINNTSIGTITNEKGAFILTRIPSGKFKLIASSVGYLTYDSLIDIQKVSGEIVITLKTNPSELPGFEVLPPEPDGWKNWGELFTDIFIGTVPTRANNCKLVNPEVIKFRLNANHTLTAYSKEPLQITNYALGYEIKYKLEEFEYDLNTKLVNYSGYALFTDMAIKHPDRANRYASERWETYRGSLMHFMRAFFANDLTVQGFEMHSLGKIVNPEKERAKLMFSIYGNKPITSETKSQVGFELSSTGEPINLRTTNQSIDSTDYFKKALKQPDSLISHAAIPADSIGFAADSSIAGFYFGDSLEVSYKLKETPGQYRVLSKEHKLETYPVSQFVFVNKRPVFILANGYYYKPYDLKITGFWAWSECMSTRIPYDYAPGKK